MQAKTEYAVILEKIMVSMNKAEATHKKVYGILLSEYEFYVLRSNKCINPLPSLSSIETTYQPSLIQIANLCYLPVFCSLPSLEKNFIPQLDNLILGSELKYIALENLKLQYESMRKTKARVDHLARKRYRRYGGVLRKNYFPRR